MARKRRLKANDRLASLRKNVSELQKLLEMKNQNLAELQKQASKPEPVKLVEPPRLSGGAEADRPAEAR